MDHLFCSLYKNSNINFTITGVYYNNVFFIYEFVFLMLVWLHYTFSLCQQMCKLVQLKTKVMTAFVHIPANLLFLIARLMTQSVFTAMDTVLFLHVLTEHTKCTLHVSNNNINNNNNEVIRYTLMISNICSYKWFPFDGLLTVLCAGEMKSTER
jgi:hypothetical protein